MVKRNNNRRTRRSGGNQTVTVAVDGDVAGARFDKMVSNMRSNESATPVLIKAVFGIATVTAAGGGLYSFQNLITEDDFASFAAQFTTYKVKAMRFEVYHINPGLVTPIAMSTVHIDGGNVTNLLTQSSVVDGEDSKYMDPGAGKQVFYWNARGSLETEFQGVQNFTDFGGFRYFNEGVSSSAGTAIARVIVTAQVVFRGRT